MTRKTQEKDGVNHPFDKEGDLGYRTMEKAGVNLKRVFMDPVPPQKDPFREPILTEDIEALRAIFDDGYTSNQINAVLAVISNWTGQVIAVEWDFNDAWGLGGNSEMFAYRHGNFYQLPEGLWEFLTSKGNTILVESFRSAPWGEIVKPTPRFRFSDHNFARESDPSRELG
jgi:hypothetical protein